MSSSFGRISAWTEMDRAGQQEIPAGDGRRLELWAYLDAYTFRSGEEVAVAASMARGCFAKSGNADLARSDAATLLAAVPERPSMIRLPGPSGVSRRTRPLGPEPTTD